VLNSGNEQVPAEKVQVAVELKSHCFDSFGKQIVGQSNSKESEIYLSPIRQQSMSSHYVGYYISRIRSVFILEAADNMR